VAKPELGTKRLCGACGAKFYDLNKETIVCPKCSTVFIVAPVVSRSRPEPAIVRPVAAAAAVAPVAVKEPELEPVEAEGAEFVSLEEADVEVEGKAKVPAGETAETEEEEIAVADEPLDTFIEEQEEGDPDVTDIIGESIEKEEET
jgi:uncharacterized protein (TIGR02300 family)